MIIIGLIGQERVGKDTFADYICQKYSFKKYNLAQPIKEIAKIMFGWDEEQLNGKNKDVVDTTLGIKPRDFFTWFGTEIGQFALHQKFPDLQIPVRSIWSLSMDTWIKEQIENNHNGLIVIPDVRFCHEVDVLNKYNAVLINITKSSITSGEKQVSNNNYQLEEILQNYLIPYQIDNNSTLQNYKKEITKLMIKIIPSLDRSLIQDEELKSNYSMYI